MNGSAEPGQPGTLGLDPHLPEWAAELTLRDLSLGEQELAVHIDGTRIRPLGGAAAAIRHLPRAWDTPGCV